jgi:hypothetical protein
VPLPKKGLFEQFRERWQEWLDIPSDEMKQQLAEKIWVREDRQFLLGKGHERDVASVRSNWAAGASDKAMYEEINATTWRNTKITEDGYDWLIQAKRATTRTEIREMLARPDPYALKPSPQQSAELEALSAKWQRDFDAAHRPQLPFDPQDVDPAWDRGPDPRLEDLLGRGRSGDARGPGPPSGSDVPLGGPSDSEILKRLGRPARGASPDVSPPSGDDMPPPGDRPPDVELPFDRPPSAPPPPDFGPPSGPSPPDFGPSVPPSGEFPQDADTPQDGIPVPRSPSSGPPGPYRTPPTGAPRPEDTPSTGVPPPEGAPAPDGVPPVAPTGPPTGPPVSDGSLVPSGPSLPVDASALPITTLEAAGGAVVGAGVGAGVAKVAGAGLVKAIGIIAGGIVIGILVVGTVVLVKKAFDDPAGGATAAQSAPAQPGVAAQPGGAAQPDASGRYSASGPMDLKAFGTEFIARVTVTTNEVHVAFPAQGGAVDASSIARVRFDDYPLGEIVYSIAVGAASGFLGGATGGAAGEPAVDVPPEYATCVAGLTMDVALTGRYDAGTKTMSGEAVNTVGIEVPTTCPPEAQQQLGGPPETGTWTATFDGSKLRGTIRFSDFDLPFTATVP